MRLYFFAIITLFFTTSLLAQNVNIPDANFKNYLVNNTAINTNGDGEISVTEAASFTGAIKVFDKGITDLTGIEAFVKLTTLNCAYNKLTTLNISKNTGLIFLYCGQNPLTTLDVSKNTALITIDCFYNQLTTLDVSNTIKLTSLYCYNNQLTAIDVSKNLALTTFECRFNMLTTLDVSKNTALKELYCSNNALTTLDVSKNTVLTHLYCGDNQLTTLDVSKNTVLTDLYCGDNQFTTLDFSENTALAFLICKDNKLTTLDMRNGKNSLINFLDATNNPTLFCISVDNPEWASQNWKNIDKHTTFNTNCFDNYLQTLFTVDKTIGEIPLTVQFTNQSSGTPNQWHWDFGDGVQSTLQNPQHTYTNPGTYSVSLKISNNSKADSLIKGHLITVVSKADAFVTIPDTAFKNYLLKQTTINTNADDEISELEAAVFKGEIDVNNKGILTLTGIEAFFNLTALECNGNNLSTLDVSKNKALNYLNCSWNQLIALDVTNNTELTELVCYKNQLSSLDVSLNTALTNFDCSLNKISTLDISKNIALTTLSCHTNQLTVLELSKNQALRVLFCFSNYLTLLDLSKNTSLNYLRCEWNRLASLNVRNGNNRFLTSFSATHNPNLYCISVDDVVWASENLKNIDNQTSFNNNCLDNGFQAYFTPDIFYGEIPLTVTFSDKTKGTPITWYWNFGDNSTSIVQNPSHTFIDTGSFIVNLRVTKDSDTSYYSQKITCTERAKVRQKINPFPGKARSGAVSFVINNQAYVGLGKNADTCFSDFWQFNPLTDTWSAVAPFPGNARESAVAFVVNEKAYVGLGCTVKGWDNTRYNDFYEYNPKENAWKQVADFGGSARNNAVAFAIGDTAYVGTGASDDGATSDFWKYTPGTNQWIKIQDFTGGSRNSAVAFVIDGKGYVSGGQDITENGTTVYSDVQEYNPSTGKWIEKVFADGINLSFNSATAIGKGKKAFIMYGNKDKVVSYTPQTNTVEDLGDMLNLQDERFEPVSFILNGAAYFGLGTSYGGVAENFASVYHNDIQHIDLPFAYAPEDLLLSNDSIDENLEYGSLVGTFSTVDENETDTFSYEILSDVWGLYIENDSLKTTGNNFETDSVFYITIKTTDIDGFTFEKAFTIKVYNVNEAPWQVDITSDTVLSDAPIGTFVGKFIAYDDDAADIHAFKFDATRSDADTAYYKIVGDSLLVAGSINAADFYHDFYVLAIDKGGLEYSSSVLIDIIKNVGIRMIESAENQFVIYPNPVGDLVTIQSKNNNSVITELLLVNALGKTVSRAENIHSTNYNISVTGFEPGVYFLLVRTQQGSYMQKIAKE